MSEQSDRKGFVKDKLHLLILIFLLINTALIAYGYYYVIDRLAVDDSPLTFKLELARDLSDYNRRLADELDVYEVASVREALAEYNYAIETASSSDDLFQIIFSQGKRVQEIIFKEADAGLKAKVLTFVNNDNRVRESTGRSHLFISFADGRVSILPDQYLEPATVRLLNNIYAPDRYPGKLDIDIEVIDGVGSLVEHQTYDEQIRVLNEDINSLRLRLHEVRVQAGLAEMVGPGLTLLAYDAEEPESSDCLVHDGDIRDIVNELFSAGAEGISIGNQRLTATSSIRCSGPLIMVNYHQITTNPVVINAVGDPELLFSGLSIILNELERIRGLEFEVSMSGFIMLPAYVPAY